MKKTAATVNPEYDIVIVGGGMVGISLALLLAAQKPWKILLLETRAIEDSASPDYSPSFDARSTALSWSSREIYQSCGLWSRLEQQLSAIRQIHVSDRGHIGLTRIEAREAGVEALGYVVENRWLGRVLLNQLAQTETQIRGATKVTDLKPLLSSMQLSIAGAQADSTEQRIDARLVIIADGAGSTTAQKLGIQTDSKAYDQSSIIANISLDTAHAGVAYERFTKQGPMALLPLTDFAGRPRSALVWTQSHQRAEELMAADERHFLDSLQQCFGHRLGRFMQVGERHCYPLALTTASEQVRSRLAVVGNAAHSLHPVAGQGFNLCLRDAAALARTLGGIPEQGDIGALDTLHSYQQQQLADQRNTLMFSDCLPKLFSASSGAVALGRNAGLLAMTLIPSLRKQFARFGMGITNRETGHG